MRIEKALEAGASAAPMRRTADVLVDVLAQAGVRVVFGLPGGPISPIHDALIDRGDVRVITTRHESGALFAAAGYAQTTGKLGVAVVTSGPGALNAMTGLASAHCDGLPVLLLVGEVPRRVFGKGALQDGSVYSLNIVGMAQHISKLAAELAEPQQAPALLRRAIATALSGRRGPVALTVPMDTATALVAPSRLALDVHTHHGVHAPTLDELAETLALAQRPLILAGSGVRRGDGPARLRQVAERLQCPVITTPKAKGVFPEDHPLALGVFGLGGHPSARAYLEEGVDVLLVIGSSLGDVATDGWSPLLTPRRTFIQVDIDARQIGRSYPVALGIVAPAEMLLGGLLDRLPQLPPRHFGGVTRHELEPGEGPGISPQQALEEIQAVLPPDTIYTVDSGEHFLFAAHYLRTTLPDSFLVMTGLGSMGQSVGAAVGAQLARPGRTVAALCGDGCFAMNAFEVATAVAQELPIIVFVMNDQRLGMVELGHAAVYGRKPSYPTGPMEVCRIAAGLGADAISVDRPGQILEAAARLSRRRGPVVVDVRIDTSVKMPKKDRMSAFAPKTKAHIQLVQ